MRITCEDGHQHEVKRVEKPEERLNAKGQLKKTECPVCTEPFAEMPEVFFDKSKVHTSEFV